MLLAGLRTCPTCGAPDPLGKYRSCSYCYFPLYDFQVHAEGATQEIHGFCKAIKGRSTEAFEKLHEEALQFEPELKALRQKAMLGEVSKNWKARDEAIEAAKPKPKFNSEESQRQLAPAKLALALSFFLLLIFCPTGPISLALSIFALKRIQHVDRNLTLVYWAQAAIALSLVGCLMLLLFARQILEGMFGLWRFIGRT